MPIRLKPTSQRIRKRRRPKQETTTSSISAAASFANLEEQNYTRLYNDITNPLDIMKCRHPLETGLKLSDIINPNNDRFNRNILKKICISDNEFDHLCENPNTSSKYRNLFLTPIQKAMTYCMIHDGGSTTDEAILAFIMRFWKTISTYNNSDMPGSTHQKYRGPPTKRILHINYTIIRGGLPLFVEYGEDRWGANTIDGVKVGNPNSRSSSKESISKINSYNHLRKEETSDQSKGDEGGSKRNKRRSGQSLSNSSSNSKSGESNSTKSDIKIQKFSSSDLARKSSLKTDSSIKKSGSDDSKSTQRETRSQKSSKDALNGNSSNESDTEKSNRLNDQNNTDSDSNLSENSEKGTKKGKRSNMSDGSSSNAKISRKSSSLSSSAPSNPNSKFSSFASLSSTKNRGGRFGKRSYLLTSNSNLSDGETFQELLLKVMKDDIRNRNSGMTVAEIAQACQNFKYAPGAYYELPLERRVKSVLFMKKQLKEVDYIEENGSWVAIDGKKKDTSKELAKKVQKLLNENDNNVETVKNDSESENDDGDEEEDSLDDKNAYLPEKLRILNMKELTIYDLWNIVNDVGLY